MKSVKTVKNRHVDKSGLKKRKKRAPETPREFSWDVYPSNDSSEFTMESLIALTKHLGL